MAGQPKTREGLQAIADAGGEDYVFARVAEGATIKALAAGLGIARSTLSAWCNADTRRDGYAHARREAAQAHAEDALGIVDDATPETVQVAKLRSDSRRWMAARMDPGSWGESRGPLVSLNIQEMHLEAVKALGCAHPAETMRGGLTLEHDDSPTPTEGDALEYDDYLQ